MDELLSLAQIVGGCEGSRVEWILQEARRDRVDTCSRSLCFTQNFELRNNNQRSNDIAMADYRTYLAENILTEDKLVFPIHYIIIVLLC